MNAIVRVVVGVRVAARERRDAADALIWSRERWQGEGAAAGAADAGATPRRSPIAFMRSEMLAVSGAGATGGAARGLAAAGRSGP